MKQIALTKAKITVVDDEDFENLNRYPWCAIHNQNGNWYAARRERGTKRYILMHRQIMAPQKGYQVDHINHDGLDNRRCNLRVCTPTQNRGNQFKRKNSLVSYKGVVIKSPGRYMASIKINRVNHYIGTYSTPEEAARAYDAKAIELFGEFALTNFGGES